MSDTTTPALRRQRVQQLAPLREQDNVLIQRFLDAIWAEQGLARASLDSYRRDLEGLARWRDGAGGGLAAIDRAGLFDYLAWRARHGWSPRSNAGCCRRCGPSLPMRCAGASAARTPVRCWTRRSCRACCPRPWPKARSMRCWLRRTWTHRWACATGRCWS